MRLGADETGMPGKLDILHKHSTVLTDMASAEYQPFFSKDVNIRWIDFVPVTVTLDYRYFAFAAFFVRSAIRRTRGPSFARVYFCTAAEGIFVSAASFSQSTT